MGLPVEFPVEKKEKETALVNRVVRAHQTISRTDTPYSWYWPKHRHIITLCVVAAKHGCAPAANQLAISNAAGNAEQ